MFQNLLKSCLLTLHHLSYLSKVLMIMKLPLQDLLPLPFQNSPSLHHNLTSQWGFHPETTKRSGHNLLIVLQNDGFPKHCFRLKATMLVPQLCGYLRKSSLPKAQKSLKLNLPRRDPTKNNLHTKRGDLIKRVCIGNPRHPHHLMKSRGFGFVNHQ